MIRPTSVLLRALRHLGSLRLSVILLAASILLVFFGTLDQVRMGLREAQQLYFESFLVIWRYPSFWPLGEYLQWLPLPLPGGYTIGPLLFLNLVFSHLHFFRNHWTYYGIPFIHAGLLMLLAGQLVTNLLQKENYLWLDEGASSNYLQSFHEDELYLSQHRADGTIATLATPFEQLQKDRPVSTPFQLELRVLHIWENADLQGGGPRDGYLSTGADQGLAEAMTLVVKEIPPFRSNNEREVRTALVEVTDGQQSLGRWLLANLLEDKFPPQTFVHQGTMYSLGLRYRREYLPFTLTLLDFQHDRYPGTNIPSNFSSRVRIDHPARKESREVMIFMNNPLRYEGWTFYQASFAKQDQASMFQVVKNPGWLLPYVACLSITFGLLYQFSVVAWRLGRKSHP